MGETSDTRSIVNEKYRLMDQIRIRAFALEITGRTLHGLSGLTEDECEGLLTDRKCPWLTLAKLRELNSMLALKAAELPDEMKVRLSADLEKLERKTELYDKLDLLAYRYDLTEEQLRLALNLQTSTFDTLRQRNPRLCSIIALENMVKKLPEQAAKFHAKANRSTETKPPADPFEATGPSITYRISYPAAPVNANIDVDFDALAPEDPVQATISNLVQLHCGEAMIQMRMFFEMYRDAETGEWRHTKETRHARTDFGQIQYEKDNVEELFEYGTKLDHLGLIRSLTTSMVDVTKLFSVPELNRAYNKVVDEAIEKERKVADAVSERIEKLTAVRASGE